MSKQRGFSLVELVIVMFIFVLLAAVAIPMFGRYADRARTSKAIGDIGSISLAIERFRLKNNDRIPNSLSELDMPVPRDPWEQEYRYLRFTGPQSIGKARKDGRLVPLNSDFDLYSIGADGSSSGSLSAKSSWDDIVRANNGAYIGLGKDY
jgi:general secretion pathway protein G